VLHRELGEIGNRDRATLILSPGALGLGTSRREILRARISFAACVIALLASGQGGAADLETGRRVFETVCAVCHGASGRPDLNSAIVQAFDPKPADLSDPLFNSREPTRDWEMVVEHGGEALGLSPVMPAQGNALGDEEIASAVAYIKTLADTRDYPPGDLNLKLPIRTKKAFPEDEVVWGSRWTASEGDDVWRNVLEFEKRIGHRGQAILELVHEDSEAESELEEVEVGYKHALAWSLEKGYLLSGALVAAIPTDDDASEEVIPYLAYAQILSPRATLQASGRAILPVDDVDLGAFELAGIVHYAWSDWPRRVFPALEATATVPFESGAGDDIQFTVVPQLRIGLTRGGHVALNLGVELPLSDQTYDYRAHLTLLWDFADGSFLKGW
jgi:mono/diheme cytochrome c family protein